MNEKKRKYDWCVSYTCSFMLILIDILGALSQNGKKRELQFLTQKEIKIPDF